MTFIGFTRKSAFWTNLIYTCISTTVQFFYLYLLLSSPWNIIAPCLTTIATTIVSIINFFNTTIAKKNKKNDITTYNYANQLFKAKLFLGIMAPCMLLNAGAAFIGGFQGILLLIGALSFSITPFALSIAITVGVISLCATTFYNIVQTYEIRKRMLAEPKQPVSTKIPSEQDAPNHTRLPTLVPVSSFPFVPKSAFTAPQNLDQIKTVRLC